MKEPKLVTVILFGVAAAIWTVRVILGVGYKEYSDSVYQYTSAEKSTEESRDEQVEVLERAGGDDVPR